MVLIQTSCEGWLTLLLPKLPVRLALLWMHNASRLIVGQYINENKQKTEFAGHGQW